MSFFAGGGADSEPAFVFCSWPLSGSYGPGARYLYYALVIICIFARKHEWLRSASLAAAMLIPAIASLHAIALTANQIHGIVDLDVFGAFQVIAIAVLAGPITLRYSKTYFNTPGRNMIFIYMLLNLAGLLSLVVAFFRIDTEFACRDGGNNIIMAADAAAVLSMPNSTGLADLCVNVMCDNRQGPMRTGASTNTFVVTVPSRGITIDSATLFSAACCIPTILQLFFMWHKILHTNWRQQNPDAIDPDEEVTTKAPGGKMTRGEERKMDEWIRMGLGLVERVVFCVLIIVVIILGEENLWSTSLRLGVEPINAVGQWGPIVGTALAALGSAYAILAESEEDTLSNRSGRGVIYLRDSQDMIQHGAGVTLTASPPGGDVHVLPDVFEDEESDLGVSPSPPPVPRSPRSTYPPLSPSRRPTLSSTPRSQAPPSPESPSGTSTTGHRRYTFDQAGRRQIRSHISKTMNWFGTPSPDRFGVDSSYRYGPYRDFPQIPGESERNPNLDKVIDRYEGPRRRGESLSGVNTPIGSFSRSRSGLDRTPSPESPTYLAVPSTNARAASASSLLAPPTTASHTSPPRPRSISDIPSSVGVGVGTSAMGGALGLHNLQGIGSKSPSPPLIMVEPPPPSSNSSSTS